jgi:hypothetical protein
MSGWRWRQQELESFPCKLAICKSSWWIYVMNTTVFCLAPPPNAQYLVFYENASEKENGIEAVAGKGNQKGPVLHSD